MLQSFRTASLSVSRDIARSAPISMRPLRIFPGSHILSRNYMVHHYTTKEVREIVEVSGKLNVAVGQASSRLKSADGKLERVKGLYVTTKHRDTGMDALQIKIGIWNIDTPDSAIAHHVSFDTNKLPPNSFMELNQGIVLILSDEPLDVKALGGTWHDTNFTAEESEQERFRRKMAER